MTKKIIELSKALIDSNDLSILNKYIEWNKKNFNYFNLETGKEHYKLLSYIASYMNKDLPIIDIGTYFGFSAAALNFYGNKVITYDVCDWIPDEEISIKKNENIQMKIMNCINDMDDISKSEFIVLDIDPHNGDEEGVIMKALLDNGFKGILLLDDIKLNEDMLKFWNDIELPKIDITSVGHWSGTGIVIYSDAYDVIL
jgi:hypothetical protein